MDYKCTINNIKGRRRIDENLYSLFYSVSAYRFEMTADYIELLIDGWNDDENYANDVE